MKIIVLNLKKLKRLLPKQFYTNETIYDYDENTEKFLKDNKIAYTVRKDEDEE